MKIIVEIDLYNHTLDMVKLHHDDFFSTDDKSKMSVDAMYLEEDPTDSSFYLFKVIDMKD